MAPRFDPQVGTGPMVRGFTADGRFRLEEGEHSAVLLTPERAFGWDAPALADLTAYHVADALALERPPEFLLLGTGPSLVRPPLAFVRALEEQGIGVEAMDSRAAARTWAVLRAEERWIAAALLPL